MNDLQMMELPMTLVLICGEMEQKRLCACRVGVNLCSPVESTRFPYLIRSRGTYNKGISMSVSTLTYEEREVEKPSSRTKFIPNQPDRRYEIPPPL